MSDPMTGQQMRRSVVDHWKAWATAIVATVVIVSAMKSWTDEQYDQGDAVQSIQKNVEYLTRLTLEDRIVRLDDRIETLDRIPDKTPDQYRTRNELRLERATLQRRLHGLDGGNG